MQSGELDFANLRNEDWSRWPIWPHTSVLLNATLCHSQGFSFLFQVYLYKETSIPISQCPNFGKDQFLLNWPNQEVCHLPGKSMVNIWQKRIDESINKPRSRTFPSKFSRTYSALWRTVIPLPIFQWKRKMNYLVSPSPNRKKMDPIAGWPSHMSVTPGGLWRLTLHCCGLI